MTAPVRRHRRDSGRLVVALAWAATVLPSLVQSLVAPKYRSTVGPGSLPQAAEALLADRLLTLALLGLCLVLVVGHLRDLPQDRGWVLLALLAPWLFMVTRELYLGRTPQLLWLVLPSVVVAMWVVRPTRESLVVLGRLVVLTAVISVVLAVSLPEKGIFRRMSGDFIAPEKQILPWGVLVGPFTSGNVLGQFLVLGLPAVLLLRRRERWPGAAVVVFAVVWTSARSALAAAALVVVVYLVLPRLGRLRRGLGRLMLLAFSVVALVLPVVTSDAGAFTNRGLIWTASLHAWAEDPWVGQGATYYSRIAQYSGGIASSAFHAHNQALHLLVTGGVVLLALTALMLVVVGRRALRLTTDVDLVGVLLLVALLVSGTLEVVFGFVDRGVTIPVVLVPLCVVALGARSATEGTTETSPPQPAEQGPRRYSVYT